jgi:hypothetical protein
MFHPRDRPMLRGWAGRVDGDVVVHLAAQTLQHYFTGGASAREHAVYPLSEVAFLAPVLHPPAVRVFDAGGAFAFANPAAILGPDAAVASPPAAEGLGLLPRLAAVVGAEGAIGGFTLLAEWRAPGLEPPKDRDFALGLGPLVVTPDERPPELVVRVDGAELARAAAGPDDWEVLRAYAAAGTELRTGDLLAAPPAASVGDLAAGAAVELEAGPVGVLRARVG